MVLDMGYTSGVPKVHHHLSWFGFNGLPFRTPLSSEENAFFMSTHKLSLGLFREARSLSQLAMRPVSHRFPRCKEKWNGVCLNPFIPPHVSPHLALTFIRSHFFSIYEKKKRRKPKSWSFLLPGLKESKLIPFRPVCSLKEERQKKEEEGERLLPPFFFFFFACLFVFPDEKPQPFICEVFHFLRNLGERSKLHHDQLPGCGWDISSEFE